VATEKLADMRGTAKHMHSRLVGWGREAGEYGQAGPACALFQHHVLYFAGLPSCAAPAASC
jgi:hypothetical protein